MKKTIFVAVMVVAAMFSLTACETVGKGKGKAPVETNG